MIALLLYTLIFFTACGLVYYLVKEPRSPQTSQSVALTAIQQKMVTEPTDNWL